MDKLYKDCVLAFCTKCENWKSISFYGTSYSGCACNMNPFSCSLNELNNKLKEMKNGTR